MSLFVAIAREVARARWQALLDEVLVGESVGARPVVTEREIARVRLIVSAHLAASPVSGVPAGTPASTETLASRDSVRE